MDTLPHLQGRPVERDMDPGPEQAGGLAPAQPSDPARDPAMARATARRLVPVGLVLGMELAATALLRRRLPASDPAALQAAGSAGIALLLALAALVSVIVVVLSRPAAAEDAAGRRNLAARLGGTPHGLLPLAAGLGSLWVLLRAGLVPALPAPDLACACLLALAAFPLLFVERIAASQPRAVLPEAAGLAAMLRLPIAMLLLLAAVFAAGGAAPFLASQALRVGLLLLGLAALETAARPVIAWFAPPAAPGLARASVGSLAGSLLSPGQLAPRRLADEMRRRFGIDFDRSWALLFVRRAALPVLAALLCLAWGLSGLRRVDVAQRAVYERLGAPVAVLQPGLHLLLPAPFGRVRPSELGQVHVLDVAGETGGASPVVDRSRAEDPAPAGSARLWDGSTPDISYLVARADGTRQSFEAISVDLKVLYRVADTDAAARDSLYRVADPQALVRVLARRLLAHFFAGQTLGSVMDERRERIADSLRTALQVQLDAAGSGIEIVGLLVDSLHPPVGAAAAYHRVQAAEITARTAVSHERGRVAGTLAVASRDARDARDAAQAGAAETAARAEGDAQRMRGDVRAAAAGGSAFLLERRLEAVTAALSGRPVELLDRHLQAGAIDLRPVGAEPLEAAMPPNDPTQSGAAQAGGSRP